MTNLSKKKWKLIVISTSIVLLSTTAIAIGIGIPSIISAHSQQNLAKIEKAYNEARQLAIVFLPKSKDVLSLTTASEIKKSDLIIEPNTNADLIYKIVSLDVVGETNIKITVSIQSKFLKKIKQYVVEIKGLPNKQESLQFNALRKIQKIVSARTSISNENYFTKPDLASLIAFTPSENIAKTNVAKPTFKFLEDIQKYENDFKVEFVKYKDPNDQVGTMMMVFKIVSKKFPKKIFGNTATISPIVNSQDRKTKLAKITKIISEQSFKPKLNSDKIKSNRLANALVLSDFAPFNPLNEEETKKIIDGVTIQFAPNNEWNVSKASDVIEGVAKIKLEVFISGDPYFEANKKFYTIELQNFLTLKDLMKKFSDDKNSIEVNVSSPLNLNQEFPPTSSDNFSSIENFFTISASKSLIKQFPNGFLTFSIQPETFRDLDYINGQIKAKVLISLSEPSKFDPDGKYSVVSPLKQLSGFLTEEGFRNKYLKVNADAFIYVYYNNPLSGNKQEVNIKNNKLGNLEGDAKSNALLDPTNYSLFRLEDTIKIDSPNALNLENIPNSSSFGELKKPEIRIKDINTLTGKLTLVILFTVEKTAKTNFSSKSIERTIIIGGYTKIENKVENALNAAERFLKSSVNNVKVVNKIIKFRGALPKGETLPSSVQISELSFATSAEIKTVFPDNEELDNIKIEKQAIIFLANTRDSDGTITLNIVISTIDIANGGIFNKEQSRNIQITITKFTTLIVDKINHATIAISDDISRLRNTLPSEFISQNDATPSKLNAAFKTLIKSVTINSGQLPLASWSIRLLKETLIANDKDGEMEFKFKILYASKESKLFTLIVPGFKNSIESNLDNAKIKLKDNLDASQLPSSLTKELFKSMIVGFEEVSGTIIPLSSYVISDFDSKAYDNIPLAIVSFKISRTIAKKTYTSLIKRTFDSRKASLGNIANNIANIIGKNHLISTTTKKMLSDNSANPKPNFKNTIARTIETLSNNDFAFNNLELDQKDLYIYNLSNFKVAANPTDGATNQMDAIVTVSLNPASDNYKASSTQKDATITYKVTNIVYKKIEKP